MVISFPTILLTVVLLVGGAAPAQPRQGAHWGLGGRRIELTGDAASQVHEVGVSPGLTTAIVFHGATIDRGGVMLEGSERVRVSVAEDTLLLLPSEQANVGDRLRLNVPFQGTAAPASITFAVVVHPAQAERQVEVFRQARTAESLRAEMREKDAQLQQCRERVASMQSEAKQPGGLRGLRASGVVDNTGIAAKGIGKTFVSSPGNALRVVEAWTYRAASRVAVEVELINPEGAVPWTAEGAVLTNKAGEALRVLPVWQLEPITSDSRNARVIVEAEASENEARGPFVLKLWEAGGMRTVTLGNVTFP